MNPERSLIQLCLLGAALLSVLPSEAATTVVTNAADAGTGTLRQLIANAASGDTITFATNLSGATILLTSGELLLSNSLTIDASALPGGVRINGHRTSRIFNVANSTTNVLTALTLTNGAGLGGVGGGIYNSGTLTVNQCTLTGNYATNSSTDAGGGVYNSAGTVTVNQCSLTGNHAAFRGGGIYNYMIGTVTVNQCTFTGNSADNGGNDGGGGGICNEMSGTLTLNQSTLTGNHADNALFAGGGGVLNDGIMMVNQCTFTTNHANSASNGGGGGIYNNGPLTVNQSTITGNHADSIIIGGGGGIYNSSGSPAINNSIVAGNTSLVAGAGDIDNASASPVNLGGAALIQHFSGFFSGPPAITNAPQLAALGNYGGPTQTMPPLPGSPAIDGCTNGTTFTNSYGGTVFTLPANDQRGVGFPRLLGLAPDIGAVEGVFNAAGPGQLTCVTSLGNGSFQLAFTNFSDMSFTVLASATLALPNSAWTKLGPVVESPAGSGQYQFTDAQATNNARRFYRVHSP